ncbi:hypothetical protein ASPFODRAFT_678031 [Aspergillus luchuensis CBS 106.47]|uniref:Uncharacterized protein n=1 Tax=Aspergillus luchuensis (strain CBS 106.47) TaxID=1137211 RepID=A0A1M3TC66_ASPLC|nr:hypothetical protein ASPFODRAFT_678031 [Aspergillus luchuensis CBS 106.47]
MRCGIFESASTSRTATPMSIIYPCGRGCDGHSVSRLSKTGIIPRSGCNVLASLIGRASIVSGMALQRVSPRVGGIFFHFPSPLPLHPQPLDRHPRRLAGASCKLSEPSFLSCSQLPSSMQQEIVVPPNQKGFHYGFTKLERGSVWCSYHPLIAVFA